MRVAVSMLILAVVAAGCGGGGDEAPAATPTPQPSALQVWQRTLASLERVTSVRAERIAKPPDVSFESVFPREDAASEPGVTPWRAPLILPLFPQSFHAESLPSLTNMRVLGQEVVDGRPHWVLGFSGKQAGIDTVDYYDAKAWIDEATHLVTRLETLVTYIWGLGGPPSGTPVFIEYSDYQLGTPATPTPGPTDTPVPLPPPDYELSPASGRCNGEVTLAGGGLEPYAFVSVSIYPGFLSEHGEVPGIEVPDGRADERGALELIFEPADDWCASPEVAVRSPLIVFVRAYLDDWSHYERLEYDIEPCVTLALPEVRSEPYCYNAEATPAPAATPTPD